MTDERVKVFPSDGTSMDLFVARPEGNAKGAVVVVQEAFGVTSHIENVCRRLAHAGWMGIAPSYFHRLEPQIVSYDDIDKAMQLIAQLDAASLSADTQAAFDWCNDQGFDNSRIGILGFCMGGSVAFFANTLRTIGAAVTYYGGGVASGRFGLPSLLELAPQMKAPWLGQYGDQDTGISTEQVEELRTVTKALPFDTDIVRYDQAGHAFNCDDRPKSYNEEAAHQAWRRTLEWFDEHIEDQTH